MPNAVVLAVHRSSTVTRHELRAGTVVLGSGEGATLVLDDPSVGTLHAVLDIADDGVFLVDLGAPGGTRLNGAPVRRAPIALGDEIALGATRLVLEAPAPPRRAAPAATPRWLGATTGGRCVEVAQLWGDSLVALAHVAPGQAITVGATPRCTFFVPADLLPHDEFPLVAPRGGEPHVRLSRGLRGHVERGGDRLPLAAWLAGGATEAEIPLAPGERIVLELAPGLTLLLQRVERPAPVRGAPLRADELGVMGVFAGLTFLLFAAGAVLRVLALLGFFATPERATELARAADLVAIFQMPEPAAAPPPPVHGGSRDAGSPEAGAGGRLTGEEGRIGRDDALHRETKGGAVKSPLDRDVDEVGVLGAMREIGVDLPAIFGEGVFAGRAVDNLGGLQGPTTADQRGPGGFALKGDGKGGGGQMLTVPGLGPRGRVPRGGDGDGDQPGKKGKKSDAIFGLDAEEIVTVGLDPTLIDAVVKKHLVQLQYCYERRLGARPELAGKVVVRFTIAADGLVTGASVDPRSSLDDPEVSKCLVERFRGMRFPPPPGKGTVGVRYPLLFKTAGK